MATPTNDSYSCPLGGVVAAGVSLLALSNATDPEWPPATVCSVPAVLGVNAPVHCKVLDTGGFGGYRYWMAFTPYPLSNDDTLENPSVVASNDGVAWVALTANPVEPAPPGAATGFLYFSDPHLVLHAGVMYLFFRLAHHTSSYSGTTTETIYYRSSVDGISWSEKTQILQSVSGFSGLLLSPCVSFDGAQWHMWSIRNSTTPLSIQHRTASDIEGPWSEPINGTMILPDVDREVWHLDVVAVAGKYAALISDRVRSTKVKGHLWLAFSADGDEWAVDDAPVSTLAPNAYRSSLVRTASGFDCWLSDWDTRVIKKFRIRAR